MDPFTMTMIGLNMLSGIRQQDQARKQQGLDVAKAKWAGFNPQWAPGQVAEEGPGLLGSGLAGLAQGGALAADPKTTGIQNYVNSFWKDLLKDNKKTE